MKLQALIAAFGCANHNNTLMFFFSLNIKVMASQVVFSYE